MGPPDDLVLLIHGTFAGRRADGGDSWWQLGSRAWTELKKRLPFGVQLPRRGQLFHWSGENSERARSKAAGDLLSHLLKLESSGQPYHLIGHSHGGSVIWGALRLATLRKKSLDCLRSWSTVGTPFLHHRTRGALNFFNLVNLALAILLLKPALNALRKLAQLFSSAWLGGEGDLILPSNESSGYVAVLRGPLLSLLEWLGVPVTATDGGIQLGAFDPTGGQSFFDYLFFSREGWLIILVTLLACYVFIQLAAFCISPVLESLRIRAEQRLENEAFQQYKARWLGIWSPDDEAINGLRATLDLSVSFVSRMVPRERVFLSDNLSLLSRPYYWMLAPIFNRLVRPHLDGAVRSLVAKTAQGNNRPAAEVSAVGTTPTMPSHDRQFPAIPSVLNDEIVTTADRYASSITPKLRQLLAEPSFVAGLERFGKTLSGHELVHTSYFDHAAILDILATHVAWSRSDDDAFRRFCLRYPALAEWFRGFKACVGERFELSEDQPSYESPRTSHWHVHRPRVMQALTALTDPRGRSSTSPGSGQDGIAQRG